MPGIERIPEGALDDIAYLSRSTNRVRILNALASDAHSIRELRERTETSRSTLNRILTEFEEREWVRRNAEGIYTATTQGEHVVVQFDPLLQSMETIRELGDVVDVFPPTELAVWAHDEVISLTEFDDVTVYRPTRIEPDKLFDPWIDRIRETETFRGVFGAGTTESGNDVVHEEIVSNGMETTVVCSGPLVDLLLDPDRGHSAPEDHVRRHETAARLHRYDGTIPCNISIFDDAVFVSNVQIDAGVETENETVRTWAEAVFERYLDAATLIPPSEIVDA